MSENVVQSFTCMPLFENMMKILHLASFYPHSILTERNNNIVGFNQGKWIKRRGGSKDIAKYKIFKKSNSLRFLVCTEQKFISRRTILLIFIRKCFVHQGFCRVLKDNPQHVT